MIGFLRDRLLDLAHPFLKWLSDIYAPYAKKQIHAFMIKYLISVAEPGDILLSQTWGSATNLIIPGEWKHVAIYIGNGEVVEAIDPKVVRRCIWDFGMTKDRIVLLRYKHFDKKQRSLVAKHACDHVGKPYDYDFVLPDIKQNNKAFYCSELGYWCHWLVDSKMQFALRKKWGQPTIIADDYMNATEYWRLIWSSH